MLFLLAASLTGCALSDKQLGRAAPAVADGKSELSRPEALMPLAPPQGPSRRIVQQLTAHWPGRQETLLCILELDKRHIAMAGLTNEGLSLFNLSYDGKTLTSDKNPLLPDTVVPEYIITDLQLAYWPAAVLRKVLPESWRLEAGSTYRRLYFRNEPRVDVRYISPDAVWPKTVDLTNHRYNYRLHIETISYDAIPE